MVTPVSLSVIYSLEYHVSQVNERLWFGNECSRAFLVQKTLLVKLGCQLRYGHPMQQVKYIYGGDSLSSHYLMILMIDVSALDKKVVEASKHYFQVGD